MKRASVRVAIRTHYRTRMTPGARPGRPVRLFLQTISTKSSGDIAEEIRQQWKDRDWVRIRSVSPMHQSSMGYVKHIHT